MTPGCGNMRFNEVGRGFCRRLILCADAVAQPYGLRFHPLLWSCWAAICLCEDDAYNTGYCPERRRDWAVRFLLGKFFCASPNLPFLRQLLTGMKFSVVLSE